ncbi:unnamed protein product [Schistosoma curassoni]|uniref:Uncharacterized protein n=1 Tax=Schistosoma curassoni TaxID=6186 RepID=A0A183JEZ2_9TREM|nr:unnamed protein product [Schistosoma curassoni]
MWIIGLESGFFNSARWIFHIPVKAPDIHFPSKGSE